MPLKGSNLTEEHKRKLSISHIGLCISQETRRKMSLGLIGHQVSQETRRKIGIANTGRKYSDAQRLANSISHIGKENGFQGKHHTEKTKEILRNLFLGRPLSKETIEKISARVSKENHWNWKGGISYNKECRHHTNTLKYREWRMAVFKRDNFTCQKCKVKGSEKNGYLEAHHIKGWSEYPEMRFNLSNGLTLCNPCHKEIFINAS